MGEPFVLRAPQLCRHQDREFGEAGRHPGLEAAMAAELLGELAERGREQEHRERSADGDAAAARARANRVQQCPLRRRERVLGQRGDAGGRHLVRGFFGGLSCRLLRGLLGRHRASSLRWLVSAERVDLHSIQCDASDERAVGMTIMYHDGNRRLQDEFESRRIADRLEEKLTRTAFSDDDKAFIESLPYFFIATADADGRPDCSFKGGLPGFVRVTGPSELAFPDYDGNGMFKSLGNLAVNPHIGLLFIAMHDKPKRLRVNGSARVSDADPLLKETVGAQLIVRVAARAIFPNCPRYIPTMRLVEPSIYAPRAGVAPVEPAWKGFADFKDYVHPRRRTARGGEIT